MQASDTDQILIQEIENYWMDGYTVPNLMVKLKVAARDMSIRPLLEETCELPSSSLDTARGDKRAIVVFV